MKKFTISKATASELAIYSSDFIIPKDALLAIEERFKELEKENNGDFKEDLSNVERILNKIKEECAEKLKVLEYKNKTELLPVNAGDTNPFALPELLSLTFYFLPFYERVLLRTLSKSVKQAIDKLPILEEFIFSKNELLIFNTINCSDNTNLQQSTYSTLKARLEKVNPQTKEKICDEVKIGKNKQVKKCKINCGSVEVTTSPRQVGLLGAFVPFAGYLSYSLITESLDARWILFSIFAPLAITITYLTWRSTYLPSNSRHNAVSFFATFNKDSEPVETTTPLLQEVIVAEDVTDEQAIEHKIVTAQPH